MIFLSKIWGWLAKSWKWIVGFLLGVFATILAIGNGPDGFKILKRFRKDEEELDEKISAELQAEAEREKRIEEETARRIAEIEEKFREKNEELEQNKKEEIERIVRETDGDPSELARRLGELTGLSVSSNDVE